MQKYFEIVIIFKYQDHNHLHTQAISNTLKLTLYLCINS